VHALIPPAFYQTRWFSALCWLMAIGLLWRAYRWRLRQLQDRLSVRLRERERIARELHDTLIQSAQGLILVFQGFAGQFSKPDPIRLKMEGALDKADQLLNEARSRVTELRTAGIDDDVMQALMRVGKELFADSPMQFSLVSTGAPRVLHQQVADEIYRVGREALSNAATHSGAKTIEVEITFGATECSLIVRDDGCGISAEILDAGSRPKHFGLQGMRERAQRIHAQLDVWSRDGAGTEVSLRVPAGNAYVDQGRRSLAPNIRWLWPFIRG